MDAASASLSAEVVAQLRSHIERGHFTTGERLPSERVLSALFGVSRPVVREALRALEVSGYLYARAGRGRFVADPANSEKSDALIAEWLGRHLTEIRDLIELRSCIEAQALRGSAMDPERIASEVVALVDAQAIAIAEGRADDAAVLDLEFHIRLASHTPNATLRSLAIALIGRANQAARAAYLVSAYKSESLRQHREIIASLMAGDLERAADLVAAHHLSRAKTIADHVTHAKRDPNGAVEPPS